MAQVKSALVFVASEPMPYLSGDQFDDDVNFHFAAQLSAQLSLSLEFKYCQFRFSLEEE